MPSFYNWTLRLFLFVALFVLLSILRAIWPDAQRTGWLDVAAIGALLLTTVAVSVWAVGAWIGDSQQQRQPRGPAALRRHSTMPVR